MGKRLGKNKGFWWSAKKNRDTDNMYFFQILDIAINVFKWKNLPDEIDPRYLELGLINRGKMIFFQDPDLYKPHSNTDLGRYLCLNCTVNGKWDFYNTPIYRRAYATNGYNMKLDEDNSVIIYNNYLRMGDIWVIEQFADRLYEIQRTIDINVKAQKTPVMLVTNDKTRLTTENFFMQYDGNKPFITVDEKFDLDGIKVLNMEAPFVAPKLQDLKHEVFNEVLTYFGVSNINSVKKERLISDEVTRNLGGTEVEKHVRLNARKEGCEKINKMFGLNVDVEYNSQIDIVVDATTAFDKTKDKQERGDDYNE